MKKRTRILIALLTLWMIGCLCTNPFADLPETPGGTTASITAEPRSSPTSGDLTAAGYGDPFYPMLGNGGYDADHYTVDLIFDMDDRSINGWMRMDATASTDLEQINLDLYGLNVLSAEVNDGVVETTRYDAELTLYLDPPVGAGSTFWVEIFYEGEPSAIPDPALAIGDGVGWMDLDSGIYMVNEPTGTMGWMPCNNYPTDKATFEFYIRVNPPYVAAANGVLVDTSEQDGVVTYHWVMDDPMSTYLASISIAEFNVRTDTSSSGVVLRNYYEKTLEPDVIAAFDQMPEMIDFYSELIAPYPFDAYGVVVMPESVGVAMENQSLSTFGADMAYEEAIAHELAHQWYGDSVTLSNWPDIWLNEGFATYMEALWMEHSHGKAAYDDYIQYMYSAAESMRAPGDVPNYAMFEWSVYVRGALVLHALRETIGDEAFFDVLRTYYDQYAYGNASTEDFIRVSEEISGQELEAFYDGWLYANTVPALP